ncbi:MAG: MerR family DNA-binding transcriptional regulator, partial [Terriglobales bacterium]
MEATISISALAKLSRVSTKTLRYWERVGLLPRAARSHTGYRQFSPDAVRYVIFIHRSKSIGLTLAEMRGVLRVARGGCCPCPNVVQLCEAKAHAIVRQIRALPAQLERLRSIQRRADTS